MRLLIINPNTSDKVSRAVEAAARRYAHPETQLTIVQAGAGPEEQMAQQAEQALQQDRAEVICLGVQP
ncbi:MAG: hypothetical protein Q6L60_11660 [Thermostichus sp. HHBFW_bins_43]